MSVRAYKLIEVKHNPDPTFNVWHDYRILDIACNENQDDFLEFQRGGLKKLLKEIKKEIPKTTEDKDEKAYYIKTLKRMIAECEDEEFVTYYCF